MSTTVADFAEMRWSDAIASAWGVVLVPGRLLLLDRFDQPDGDIVRSVPVPQDLVATVLEEIEEVSIDREADWPTVDRLCSSAPAQAAVAHAQDAPWIVCDRPRDDADWGFVAAFSWAGDAFDDIRRRREKSPNMTWDIWSPPWTFV